MSKQVEWCRLMTAAARLGQPYGVVLRKVLTGELPGEQRDGKWWVRSDAVQRLRDLPDMKPDSSAGTRGSNVGKS